jgi:integrase
MTLTVYAKPLRDMPIADVDTDAVLAVLEPIWQSKPETASRLRARIEAVLDAAPKELIGDNKLNPARWEGRLKTVLGTPKKLTRGHHAALPYSDLPGFLAKLRERPAMAALALEFLILTAARTGEVLGAAWSEFDLDRKVWTVPPVRMKAKREHRVPLTRRAVEIIKTVAAAKTGDFVFPGQRADKPLSSMSLEMLLRRMKISGATIHGFRSGFRDWAGDETNFARELAEAALAHAVGDAAEQAYRRGDALEKRRALMDAWGTYVQPVDKSLRRKARPKVAGRCR